jgi:hypothetical protein
MTRSQTAFILGVLTDSGNSSMPPGSDDLPGRKPPERKARRGGGRKPVRCHYSVMAVDLRCIEPADVVMSHARSLLPGASGITERGDRRTITGP